MGAQGLERGGVRLPVERYKDWLDGSLLYTMAILDNSILGI